MNDGFAPTEHGQQVVIDRLKQEGTALVQRGAYHELSQALAALPAAIVLEDPRLCWLQARALLADDRFLDGVDTLERAHSLAVRSSLWELAIQCAVELAQFHQVREDIEQARAYLEIARSHFEQHELGDTEAEARLIMEFARLYPDLGQNTEAILWSRRALNRYEATGDLRGQVDALWILAVVNTYRGNLQEARLRIDRALRLHRIGNMDERLLLFLTNVKAYIALYAGLPGEGLAVVLEVQPIVARLPNSKPALYLAMAEAGLHRLRGDLEASLAALGRADAILTTSGDHGYRPWYQMELSWTAALHGTPIGQARRDLLEVYDPQTRGLRRYMEFFLGGLDVLEGRWRDASRRFHDVIPQFTASQEPYYSFAARMHLAYVLLATGRTSEARKVLEAGLTWARATACDSFPYLWHPAIAAVVCVEALCQDIVPRHAEGMVVRKIGDAAVPGLMAALDQHSGDIQGRLRSVLIAIGGDNAWRGLQLIPDQFAKAAIQNHLRTGRLALSRLEALQEQLGGGDAAQRWQRLAVFGYYAGSTMERERIALELGLSEGTVKKHIGAVRAVFGIHSEGGRDTARQTVTVLAQKEGFSLAQRGLYMRRPGLSLG